MQYTCKIYYNKILQYYNKTYRNESNHNPQGIAMPLN